MSGRIREEERPVEARQSYDAAVQTIKQAILQQQLVAARQINAVQLALYYSVGRYISTHSRSKQ